MGLVPYVISHVCLEYYILLRVHFKEDTDVKQTNTQNKTLD